MKKYYLFPVMIVILSLLLTGCQPSLSDESFEVINIFKESRTYIYDRVEEESVNEVTYDIIVDGLKVKTEIVIDFDYGQFRSGSEFYANTLLPISSYKGNSYNLDPDKDWDIYAKYGTSLEMTARTPTEEESKSLELPAYYIDNEALLFTIGALVFKEGFEQNINISIIDAGEIIPFRVSLVGIEQIEVPYGTAECFKVELKYTGIVLGPKPRMYMWYSNDDNRFPLMYENNDILLKLKSISEYISY